MNDTIEIKGRTFRIDVEQDTDMRAPWVEHDGHGIVSDWTTRDKHAGEWVLASDRSSKRFYDFAATMKKATTEGWGLSEAAKATLAVKLNKPILALTRGEITAESVRLDFEYLQDWCNDQWHWCGVVVTDITNNPHAPIDYTFALWGIGSKDDDYIKQTAQDLAEQAYRAYAVEHRFANAMACGV